MARKFLTPIDLTKLELQNAAIQNLAAAPANPVTGQIYYDTVLSDLRFYDGENWVNTRSIGDLSIDDLSDVIVSNVAGGQVLFYDTGANVWSNADLNINDLVEVTVNTTSLAGGDFLVYNSTSSLWTNVDIDTDDIEEGETNLYYTDERVENVISESTTDDLSEGTTNLYYTDERVQNVISESTTDDLDEGETNLYYTDERVENVISDASINDLSDVEIGETLATGDFLVWDGTDWVNRESKLSDLSDPDTSVSMGEQLLTDLADPIDPADAANKRYVDAVAEGLHIHPSVAVATDENINLAGPLAGTFEIDGETLTVLGEGARVLVKDQTTTSQNGIYVLVDTDGDWSLVRAADHDTALEVQAGDFVFVSGGATYAATGWVQTEPVNVLGTDPIIWSQFSGAGTYEGGDGLTLDGRIFNVGEGTGITVNSDDVAIDTTVVPRKLLVNVGDGEATSFNIEHDLGTRGVLVSVFDTATYEEVITDVVKTNGTTVNVSFAVAPAANAYSVAIIG
jgi:hypothetical protein